MIFEVIGRNMVHTTCRQNWGQVAICIENIRTLRGTSGIRMRDI